MQGIEKFSFLPPFSWTSLSNTHCYVLLLLSGTKHLLCRAVRKSENLGGGDNNVLVIIFSLVGIGWTNQGSLIWDSLTRKSNLIRGGRRGGGVIPTTPRFLQPCSEWAETAENTTTTQILLSSSGTNMKYNNKDQSYWPHFHFMSRFNLTPHGLSGPQL